MKALGAIKYLKVNAKTILLIGAILITATGIYVSVSHFSEQRSDESWNTLFEAEGKIKTAETTAKNNDEAIKVYKDVIGKLKTDASKSYAMLKIADRYYAKQDWDNAVSFYSQAEKNGKDMLKQMSVFGLASSKEMKGDFVAAIDSFGKLASTESALYRPLAMLGLARCYLKKGDKAKAQESYDNIIIAFPESDYARLASAAKSGM